MYNDLIVCCYELQKLASDFLSNYVFLAVGRVGSSTELIVQKIESVQDMEKRNRLVDLLRRNVVNGKVIMQCKPTIIVANVPAVFEVLCV